MLLRLNAPPPEKEGDIHLSNFIVDPGPFSYKRACLDRTLDSGTRTIGRKGGSFQTFSNIKKKIHGIAKKMEYYYIKSLVLMERRVGSKPAVFEYKEPKSLSSCWNPQGI